MFGQFPVVWWQFISLVAAFLCASSLAGNAQAFDGPEREAIMNGQHLPMTSNPQLCDEKPAEASDMAIQRASESSNAFGLELYQKLGSRVRGNLAFSPINIEIVLTMAYAGAGSGTETERQMARVLHLDPADKQLHAGFKSLIDGLESEPRNSGLKLANRVWVKQGLPLAPSFTELTSSTYGAGVQQIDFTGTDSRKEINSWIEERTEGKIKDLIEANQLDKTTRLVLTGAIYFHEPWKSPFEEKKTKKEPFHRSDRDDDSPAKVDLMYQQMQGVRYATIKGLQVLELPYESGRSMLLVLPKERGGLPAVEEDLTVEKLKEWESRLKPQTVQVYLPRFRVTKQLGLSDVLKEMGLQQAFTNEADFSRMTASPVKISEVTHQAFVDVSEAGTDAAAGTATKFKTASAHPVFRADHPFLFMIRDSSSASATILFVGRYQGSE